MLPSFDITQKKIYESLLRSIEYFSDSELMRAIPKTILQEGNSSILEKDNGEIEETEINTIAQDLIINNDELKIVLYIDLISAYFFVLNKIKTLSEKIAEKKFKYTIETIDKAVEKVGNVTNMKGKEFQPDDLFNMLKKLWIEFDENLNPIFPTFVGGKEAVEQFKNVLKLIEDIPEYSQELKEILTLKRREFFDREANRRLVG